MDYCLRNPPRTIFDGPVCGNGFLEEGEECDCGMAKVRGRAGVRMLCMAMQKWGMGLLNLDFFFFFTCSFLILCILINSENFWTRCPMESDRVCGSWSLFVSVHLGQFEF